jgi:hypothetical protein
MLNLPGTRHKIDIQALNQRGTSKKPCCPKIAAEQRYIYQQCKMSIAAKYVAKSQVKDTRN